MIGDEDTDDSGAPAAPLKGKRHHACSFCGKPGHKVTKCPDALAVKRAERLLVIEERAKVAAAAGKLKIVAGDAGAGLGGEVPDVGAPLESEAIDAPAELADDEIAA